jgi:uncharacterized HAD superfamily protein
LDIKQNIYKIPSNIDLVVGLPRSGMIPAYMIGLSLNAKVCSIDEFIDNVSVSHGTRQIRETMVNILVVDDSLNSGNSMQKAKDRILKAHSTTEQKILYAAVYVTPRKEKMIDIALTTLPSPRIFQWNYMNHSIIKRSCFDIDGVLCVDPTEEQNDDGEKYRDFIINARSLYIPHYKIYALVTSRLEKYRKETELWLKKHNVQYEQLYMLDLPSKEERIRLNMHAKFKAEIYSKLENTVLFYESAISQAHEIARLTQKAVFCVETDELVLNPKNFSTQGLTIKQKIVRAIKIIVKSLIPVKYWGKFRSLYKQKNHRNKLWLAK